MKIGALMVCRNESDWCDYAIEGVAPYVDTIAIVRGLTSWNNGFTSLDDTREKIFSNKYHQSGKIVYKEVDNPGSDEAHRNICLEILKERGCDLVWVVDFDEFYDDHNVEKMFDLVRKIGVANCGQVYGYAYAYWRGLGYRSTTPERFGPILFNLRENTKFNYIRNVDQDPGHTFEVVLHHMTAVKTEKQMYEKINGWSHANEVIKGWYENKWLRWPSNRLMTNLHPVSPGLWPSIEKIDKRTLPKILHSHPWFSTDIVR